MIVNALRNTNSTTDEISRTIGAFPFAIILFQLNHLFSITATYMNFYNHGFECGYSIETKEKREKRSPSHGSSKSQVFKPPNCYFYERVKGFFNIFLLLCFNFYSLQHQLSSSLYFLIEQIYT